jgi:hypothetical protein
MTHEPLNNISRSKPGRSEYPIRKSDECSFPYYPLRLTATRRPPKVRVFRDRSDADTNVATNWSRRESNRVGLQTTRVV